MYKIKKYIKNNIILFLIFVVISFFGTYIIYDVITLKELSNESSSLFTNEALYLSIEENTSISLNDIYNQTKENDIMWRYSIEESYFNDTEVNILFFNSKVEKKLPIKEGRSFTEKDFEKKEKYALVGRDLNKTYKINDYIEIDNVKYKIIGILGGNAHSLDNKIYISFSESIGNKYYPNNLLIENLNSNKTRSIAQQIQEYINLNTEEDIHFNISNNPYKANSLIEILGDLKELIFVGVFVIILLIITVINISNYNIDSYKKEIGIKKLIGYKNSIIYLNYLFNYVLICLVASIISSALFIILTNYGVIIMIGIDSFNYTLYLRILLVLFVVILIISFGTCIPVLNKISKIQISEILREEE